jgi:hypothetical protein
MGKASQRMQDFQHKWVQKFLWFLYRVTWNDNWKLLYCTICPGPVSSTFQALSKVSQESGIPFAQFTIISFNWHKLCLVGIWTCGSKEQCRVQRDALVFSTTNYNFTFTHLILLKNIKLLNCKNHKQKVFHVF